MADGIMIASECADWWDEQIKNYKEELEAYVMENPTYFGIAVATAGATAADLGQMFFVDILRFGEGIAEGGVKGIVQDVLRALSVIPAGRILKGAKPFAGTIVQQISNLTFWRKVGGGLCAPIAIGQALQRTGTKLAVGLKEIADAIGQPLSSLRIDGISIGLVGNAMKKLGLQFTELSAGSVSKLDDVLALAKNSDGPIMIGIKGIRGGIEQGHAVLVSKTLSGVKIIDRAGTFSSFDELARRYSMESAWSLNAARPLFVFTNAVVDESLIHLVNRFGVLACLARMSMGVFNFNYHKVTADWVKENFQQFVAQRGKKKVLHAGVIEVVGGKTVTVKAGDPKLSTLSGIAKAEYGSFDLWPLIYDLNKDKIGPNPNRLKPNTQLLVLPLDRYDPQEVADAKKRAPSWRSYS